MILARERAQLRANLYERHDRSLELESKCGINVGQAEYKRAELDREARENDLFNSEPASTQSAVE